MIISTLKIAAKMKLKTSKMDFYSNGILKYFIDIIIVFIIIHIMMVISNAFKFIIS